MPESAKMQPGGKNYINSQSDLSNFDYRCYRTGWYVINSDTMATVAAISLLIVGTRVIEKGRYYYLQQWQRRCTLNWNEWSSMG